jgi:hypothetical protein
MAIPAREFALVPPVTWSAESLKRAEKRFDTVSPAGLVLSSLIDASVDAPLAIGASLTAVTEVDKTTVAAEMLVDPPLLDTLTTALVTTGDGVDDSINRTVSVGADPLKFAAGKNRSESVLLKVFDELSPLIELLIVVQVPELALSRYCHSPLVDSRVYPVIAIPTKVLALDPPVT